MKQNIIQRTCDSGVIVTIREGLNVKEDLEVTLTIPKHLHNVFEESPSLYEKYCMQTGHGDTTLYFGVNPVGIVSFYAYPGPGNGFGGAHIKVNTVSGEETLIGPWSSRCGVMNHAFQASMDITLETRYRLASAMTFTALNQYLRVCGVVCDMRNTNGDWTPYIRPLIECDETIN